MFATFRIVETVLAYFSKTGGVNGLHVVLAAEIDVVEIDNVPRDAHSLCQLVIPLCRQYV